MPKKATPNESQTEAVVTRPIWAFASKSDLQNVDFEEPIHDAKSANPYRLSTLFNEAAKAFEDCTDNTSKSKEYVFKMLQGVTNMSLKAGDRNEPYSPMVIFANGSRSAALDDFKGEPMEALVYAAESTTHPVLKARLCDICWFIERKRFELGKAAVAAYIDIIEKLEAGELERDKDNDDFGLTERDILKRSLQIAKLTGWDEDYSEKAKKWVVDFKKRSIDQSNLIHAGWFSELDLDYGLTDPKEIGNDLEGLLLNIGDSQSVHVVVKMWKLAAQAFHAAKDEQSKTRCRVAAAETLAEYSENIAKNNGSAMLASHWLAEAIAEYHGLPDFRIRRTELKHKLVDVQSNIIDEMSSYSHPMDIREIVLQTKEHFKDLALLEALLTFADMERSPMPDELEKAAVKSVQEFPLSSMFGTSHYDDEGKVIHRTEGGGLGDDSNKSAITAAINQQETIRRQLFAFGHADVARRVIMENFYVSETIFINLLQHSPFVPRKLLQTFALGFTRFFQGDFTSGLYILTPLLENSLRHVLKLNGHDVTTFNDAAQTQEARTITALFDAMRGELDEVFSPAITGDIERVFLSKHGPSIRHGVAHGLLSDGSPYGSDAIYACWLVFRLCCIPLFAQHEDIELI